MDSGRLDLDKLVWIWFELLRGIVEQGSFPSQN